MKTHHINSIIVNIPEETTFSTMEFDDMLKELGGYGPYQTRIFTACVLFCLVTTFPTLNIVFLAGNSDHWCYIPELTDRNLSRHFTHNVSLPSEKLNGQLVHSQCQMYQRNYSDIIHTLSGIDQHVTESTELWPDTADLVDCDQGWEYDHSQYTSTIVMQWDLVCSKYWLQATGASVYMAGFLVGVFLSGVISDIFGRKRTIQIFTLLTITAMVGIAFSPNYIIFLALRFLCGGSIIAAYAAFYVLATEVVPPDWRALAGMIPMYMWAISYVMLAGFAYFIRDWQMLQLASAAVALPGLVALFLITESPRWLFIKKRKTGGRELLKIIAKMNNAILPANYEISVKKEKKAYVWDLLRTPRIRYRTMICFFVWFVNSLTYYGLSLNTSSLAGDPYVNFAVSGALEIPAYILSHLAMVKMGRRLPLIITMLISGLSLLAALFVPTDMAWFTTILAMIGKFAVTISFAVIYIFTVELYPTCIRSVALCTNSTMARLGGVLAPFVSLLNHLWNVLPLLVFGGCAVVAGLLVLLLPETQGYNLPETLYDGENFRREFRPFGCGSDGDSDDSKAGDKERHQANAMDLSLTTECDQNKQ